jgi:hypothetical protein
VAGNPTSFRIDGEPVSDVSASQHSHTSTELTHADDRDTAFNVERD